MRAKANNIPLHLLHAVFSPHHLEDLQPDLGLVQAQHYLLMNNKKSKKYIFTLVFLTFFWPCLFAFVPLVLQYI